jgi:hypothetical protein
MHFETALRGNREVELSVNENDVHAAVARGSKIDTETNADVFNERLPNRSVVVSRFRGLCTICVAGVRLSWRRSR